MNLSPNFSLNEFTFSPRGKGLGIPNIPNAMQISALQFLCHVTLEPIRAHFNSPVFITSGFRSPELNKAIGGAPNSQHLAGEAADIHVKGVRNDVLWQFIVLNIRFDQCIAEKLKRGDGEAGWIHVSHKRDGKQRGEGLSFLGNGEYVTGLQYVD